jgi:predicted transposase YbfD/YdcC
MKTEGRLRLADVFVSITDPRQASQVEYDLVEWRVVAVNAVWVGADTFIEIEAWAKAKLGWLRRYLKLEHGIPSHDPFGRLFGLIDPLKFEAAFRRWVSRVAPRLDAEIVAIEGKTSRRTGQVDAPPLHRVSAFAAGAGRMLGQRATAKKSNAKTAIPQCISALLLEGGIVTIDTMGTPTGIAQAIRGRGADDVRAVKDNQTIWPNRSATSLSCSRKRQRKPRPRSSRRWKRIMDAWKPVAVMLSTHSTVCIGPNDDRGSNPSR